MFTGSSVVAPLAAGGVLFVTNNAPLWSAQSW
jgi:hypothetical protein